MIRCGCPYQCHFCVSGTTEWNELRGFDLDRVKAEIDYALSRSGSKDLILTDENWGVLGDRDVELARFIMGRSRAAGSPSRLYYYTAEVVTDAARAIVETVAPIAWLSEFTMSFQTLNPLSRAAIKRTNIGLDQVAFNVRWARERDIQTASEMIYGLPYETPETFFGGVERLGGDEGIDRLILFPLMLFPGIDLAAQSVRERYGIQTRFRLADNGYGAYDGGQLVSAEAEEVVVATRWASREDFFTVRRYGLFHEVAKARRYLSELLVLSGEIGVAGHGVLRHLARADYSPYPALASLLADHRGEAEAELKPSREEVRQEVTRRLKLGREVTGVRLNLVYLGKLMSSAAAARELMEVVTGYFEAALARHPHREVVLAYPHEALPHRLVLLDPSATGPIQFETRFDYPRWAARDSRHVSELLLHEPRVFQATTSEARRGNLVAFDPTDRFALQRLFEKTPSKHLLRSVELAPPEIAPDPDLRPPELRAVLSETRTVSLGGSGHPCKHGRLLELQAYQYAGGAVRVVTTKFAEEVLTRLPLAQATLGLAAFVHQDGFLGELYRRRCGDCYEEAITFPHFLGLIQDALLNRNGSLSASLDRAHEQDRLSASRVAHYGKLRRTPPWAVRRPPPRARRSASASVPDQRQAPARLPRPLPGPYLRRQESQEGRQAPAAHARRVGQALRRQAPGQLGPACRTGRCHGRRPGWRGQRVPAGAGVVGTVPRRLRGTTLAVRR